MISSLTGIVTKIFDTSIIVSLENISFLCYVPRAKDFILNNSYCLTTYFSWNNELGPTLFGFLNYTEYELFLLLLSCNGIGPKMSLSLINTLSCDTICHAIIDQKPKVLTEAPGIGLKKAEMIVIELKNKIKNITSLSSDSNTSKIHKEMTDDIAAALEHLGYTNAQIFNALKELDKIPDIGHKALPDLIRITLGYV